MEWYSYFLLNVPESFGMIMLTLVLLGIFNKRDKKSVIKFSFINGGVSFTLNIFMANSLKPLLLFIVFSLLVSLLFRQNIINAFIIGLLAFVELTIFELTLLPIYIKIFSISYSVLLEDTWQRIFATWFTLIMPMLTVAWILKKLRIQFKIPLLFNGIK